MNLKFTKFFFEQFARHKHLNSQKFDNELTIHSTITVDNTA